MNKKPKVKFIPKYKKCYFCNGKGCKRCNGGKFLSHYILIDSKNNAFIVDTLK